MYLMVYPTNVQMFSLKYWYIELHKNDKNDKNNIVVQHLFNSVLQFCMLIGDLIDYI
jgi:hypothetical protein